MFGVVKNKIKKNDNSRALLPSKKLKKGKIVGCHTWCYNKIDTFDEFTKEVNVTGAIEKEISKAID